MKKPLYVTTYNRDEITLRSLQSLAKSALPDDVEVIIIDDGSEELLLTKVRSLCKRYSWTLLEEKHIGIPFCKVMRINMILRKGKILEECPYFLISDSDMLYSKNWAQALDKIFNMHGYPVITGFDTRTNQHDVLEECNYVGVKASIGGANLLIGTDFYKSVGGLRNAREWDWSLTTDVKKYGDPLICTLPSIVDHIGEEGVWARQNYHDRAKDFIGENSNAMGIFNAE